MKYQKRYELAKQQLREKQLLTPQGRTTAPGQQLVEYFFPDLDASRYLRNAKAVLPEHHSLDELLYTMCCLVWYDQSPVQKSQIRQWAEQNHLHPAAAPIIAAAYVVEHQQKSNHDGGLPHEETASYTGR